MTSISDYTSFEQLSGHEAADAFAVVATRRPSPIAIIAPHGGSIEPGTSELALAVAADIYSCYTFDGLLSSGNERLHIRSTLFDEPMCLEIVQASEIVAAIHGCSGDAPLIYVGGRHRALKRLMMSSLESAGFDAREPHRELLGADSRNICNRCRTGAGVQLELSDGLRRGMFKGFRGDERCFTEPLFSEFVAAVQKPLAPAAQGQLPATAA